MLPLSVHLPGDDYHRELISCQVACPVHTDARGYVRAIAEGRFEEAYLIARGPNPFASICGRICGAPCEAACRRGHVPRIDDDGHFVAQDRPICGTRGVVRSSHGPSASQAGQVTEPDGWRDYSIRAPSSRSTRVFQPAFILPTRRDAR